MRNLLILLVIFSSVAGCIPSVEKAAALPQVIYGCQTDDLGGLIGQEISVLPSLTFAQPPRVIGPNDLVTMDHDPNRLNIKTDDNGIIRQLHCG